VKCVEFPQANHVFGPPPGMSEDQVQEAHVFVHDIEGGSCSGHPMIVVAWQPTLVDIERLREGELMYLTIIGEDLPAHFLSTSFKDATNPE